MDVACSPDGYCVGQKRKQHAKKHRTNEPGSTRDLSSVCSDAAHSLD